MESYFITSHDPHRIVWAHRRERHIASKDRKQGNNVSINRSALKG